jgi:AraC-like DNA-binding protein
LFFMSYRYPERTQWELGGLGADSGGARIAPSSPGIDGQKILARLERIVVAERGYRDPDITRQSLGPRLGIRECQLSQALHDGLGINFRDYITRYRLAEAKSLLVEKPDPSILDIAFAVGFNSKYAFNAPFAKETGLSPSDFRKNNITPS